jgi:hypothetical protein
VWAFKNILFEELFKNILFQEIIQYYYSHLKNLEGTSSELFSKTKTLGLDIIFFIQ